MDKEYMGYTYTIEYSSAIKMNEILPYAAIWMDLEGIMLSEVSQTEGQILYDITYMWNLKKYNKLVIITKKQIHRYKEQTSGYHRGEGRDG